jgi:hypothetical protein
MPQATTRTSAETCHHQTADTRERAMRGPFVDALKDTLQARIQDTLRATMRGTFGGAFSAALSCEFPVCSGAHPRPRSYPSLQLPVAEAGPGLLLVFSSVQSAAILSGPWRSWRTWRFTPLPLAGQLLRRLTGRAACLLSFVRNRQRPASVYSSGGTQ